MAQPGIEAIVIRRLLARWFISETQLARDHLALMGQFEDLQASLAADLAGRQAAAQELRDELVRLAHRRSRERQAVLDAEQRLIQLRGLT